MKMSVNMSCCRPGAISCPGYRYQQYVIFLILALLTHLSLVATFVVTENQVYDGITLRMKEEFASYESHNVNNSGSIVSGFLMAAAASAKFSVIERSISTRHRNILLHSQLINIIILWWHMLSRFLRITLKAPIECCKVIEPEVETGCPNKFTRTNSYFFDGCESNLRQYLHGHIPVIVYASLCVVPLDSLDIEKRSEYSSLIVTGSTFTRCFFNMPVNSYYTTPKIDAGVWLKKYVNFNYISDHSIRSLF
ncbi:hypothetical protein CLF_100501 [Clonorchis sinensis]|uniref:Uncharacterized protein n=1 Tax=Clonorchis sinensis TaxID=79923 RepID=G7Y3L7_CLOSI|nr:hypothetical protein CLF_100501 [Clonorchis sinensis]